MSFDGIFTHYMVKELKNNLLSGRINKIYQLSDYELVFVIRADNRTQKLLMSIHPIYARVHLTDSEYSYPKEPPMFCMLLRKHLEGGIIVDIDQKDNDRIVRFSVEHINEMGDREIKRLFIELMGKYANIVLLNTEDTIIDSIKHISPFQNSVRTLQPGAEYIYPPAGKKNFFQGSASDFDRFTYDDNIKKQLVAYFEGLSPLLSAELIYRAHFNTAPSVFHAYQALIEKLETELAPAMMSAEGKQNFYLFPLESLGGEVKTFSSLSELLDRFYFNKDSSERIKQKTQDLEKYLKGELDKLKHKFQNLETDLLTAKNGDIYKICGELILANVHLLSKGKTSCELINFYDSKTVQIELDPLLTPVENAQKYFTKYQKSKKAISHLQKQLEITQEEIAYFELLNDQLRSADVNDALEIREELEKGGYLKASLSRQKKNQKPQYAVYRIDGIEILVGKNNLQNEYITHKVAARTDLWMHVKDMPGSHVIVRTEVLTEAVLRTAANLAAYFSKGKQSSSVPVDYTLVKYVKKVPGAKPGFVTYDHQKTIYIDPDEDLIASLKN